MERDSMKRRRGVSSRAIIVLLAFVLVVGFAVGGTFAWLAVKTNTVANTFTYGDINIKLEEKTGENYKIIPGVDIAKDPKVTVLKDSEACWLFVKIEETNWPEFKEDDETLKVNYAIAEGWIAGTGTGGNGVPVGVFYRTVSTADAAAGKSFDVLKENTVNVSENLTKAEVDGITEQPTLTFTAYAIQSVGIDNVATAWEKVSA